MSQTSQKYKMMPGSESGPSYLVFARNGNVALGVKPLGMRPGHVQGMPGTTLFAGRVRSAKVSSGFWGEDSTQKVVKLNKDKDNLVKSWPNINFEKVNAERASFVAFSFMPGEPDGTPEQRKEFQDSVGDGKIGRKWADYLIEMAGEENLVLTKHEMAEWFNSYYSELFAKIMAFIAEQDAEKAKAKDAKKQAPIGSFGQIVSNFNDPKNDLEAEEIYKDPEEDEDTF